MAEFQQDFIGIDKTAKGSKWAVLPARCTEEEKRDISLHCRAIIKLPYSVVTRLIWRRIISDYRSMPQAARFDAMQDVDQAVDYVVAHIPVVKRQMPHMPRGFF